MCSPSLFWSSRPHHEARPIRKESDSVSYCENCHKKVFLGMSTPWWFHKSDRWPQDNGYYCFEDNFRLTAEPSVSLRKRAQASHLMTWKDWSIREAESDLDFNERLISAAGRLKRRP